MTKSSSDLQSQFADDFDLELERFRKQLRWLIENVPVQKGTRLVKRTNKSIVQQIQAQHPGFKISEPMLSNLLSGNKHVVVTIQLASYLVQVFGLSSVDFFLDPDIERQRRLVLHSQEQLAQRQADYAALDQQAGEAGILAALRAMPAQERAAFEQLILLRAGDRPQSPSPPPERNSSSNS